MLLLFCAMAVLLASSAASLALAYRPKAAATVGALGAVAGSALGAITPLQVLFGRAVPASSFGWSEPFGTVVIGVDPLSAFFLMPLFGLGAVAAVYGRGYLDAGGARGSTAVAWCAYNLLVGSMALVLLAQNGLLFLVAWEAMALAAYLLVSWAHHDAEVRRAGWVYLIATHAATALLIALFLLLGRHAGSLDFGAFRSMVRPGAGSLVVLFVLATVGFGAKAGFVPLHVWLPEAHAAAPSHVSALMSGVLIKMGIYGLLRTLTFFGGPATWWGPAFMLIGLAGGAIGIALAAYQRDLKTALAYSSVENIGVVMLGLGLGFWGWTTGRVHVAALGFGGGLLHVWNHALMKGAMFLCAGSVLHGAGTRDLERLGGLMKRMPFTGAAMVLGGVAIGALPPMNGFVSEWLIYMGLLQTGADRGSGIAALLAIGLLALIGGMTALAFVRLLGIALLGVPRSDGARAAHEPALSMRVPMAILVASCALSGMFPALLVGPLGRVAQQIVGASGLLLDASLLWTIGACNAGVWGMIGFVWLVWAAAQRHKPVGSDTTWGCGYAAPTSRMQYTARSFAEIATSRLLPARFAARVRRPETAPFMPIGGEFATECVDPFTRGVYEPFLERWARRFQRLRWMQQGALHAYLTYILAMVVLGLAWVSIRGWVSR